LFVCAAEGGMSGSLKSDGAKSGWERLKIVIFNLGICDAARPKVPTHLDAAYAAE